MGIPLERNTGGARYINLPIPGVAWRPFGDREWAWDDVETDRLYIWSGLQKSGLYIKEKERWVSAPTYIDWAKRRQSVLKKQQAFKTTGRIAAVVGGVAAAGLVGAAIVRGIVDGKTAQTPPAEARTAGTFGTAAGQFVGGLLRPAVQTTQKETSAISGVVIVLLLVFGIGFFLIARKG